MEKGPVEEIWQPHHHWAQKICMNWSVFCLRLREMNCLWVEPPCPPTASPSLLRLPASCFKLPVAFCSCSFICSTMDSKACSGVWGGPYFYHTDGRFIAAHRTMWHHSYIWTAAILFFIHVFLHVIHIHLPVTPAERSSLYMCALLLQSREKKKKE